MFRRSRFSVRPNVGTAGRAAATPQDTPSASQEATETLKDTASTAPVTDNKSDVAASEKAPAGDGNDNNRDGSTSSAAVQRRKRFAIKPKVAPGRTSTPSRMAKSPVKAVSEKHHEAPGSDVDKPITLRQSGSTPAPHGLQSPRRRRLSEDTSKQLTMQPKTTSTSSESSGASVPIPAGDSVEQTQQPAESGKQLENVSSSQVKPILPRPPDKVPPSLPDKEAIEISEKAKTLVSKSLLSLTPSAMSLSRLLNDPSDLQRLVKAQKLRELLRQERRKEMKLKKAKSRPKEYTLDPTKMTMRDLIHYLPTSNPMPSSLEESVQEGETVVPPSPEREESPEQALEPEEPPEETNTAPTREDEEEEEEQEEALMVPQVKVAEDGSLIIDEESLTVEVQRAKGPNPAYNRDPIFERGSTTTYSSFRKGICSKPWSSEETDMFFLAISMVGTDFSMICQLFPHRARSEIKNKFKKEERENTWRIDKAFRERRKLDIEYFSKLLEKIFEVQKNRKKLKSLTEKNTPKKRKGKAKGKKKLSDVEDEEDENQPADLEKEVEEGGIPAAELKKKRKRKENPDALTEEGNEKKKTTKKGTDQGEAGIPEDAEAALPEDHTNPEMSEKGPNDTTAKDTVIKPAKLSRGRAAKPLVPLGRKWGNKTTPATKAKDADKEAESEPDGASKEQEIEDSSPLSQAEQKKSAGDDSSEEEEDITVKPPKPTRYGRVPKPTKQLNYPAKEDAPSSASACTPASPGRSPASAKPKPKCTAKRERTSKQQPGPVSKKPKLVTLRASQSESSEEEYEKQWQEEEQQYACSSGKDSTAPVFVPGSLDTPQPELSELDESMVELDILDSMPDVLGISQDALCPDSTCEQAQRETGTAEPCEHQLDLLVDVIDFLSSEHTEVSEDESYNEAAQTLLTIGNLAHLSQSAQNLMSVQDHITEMPSAGVCETSQLVDEITSKPAAQEERAPVSAGQEVTQTSESDTTVELQGCVPDSRDVIKTSEQESDCDPTPAAESYSPQVKRGRMSMVKPKPNHSQSSRTALPKSKPGISTVSTVAFQDHETVAAAVQAETVAAAVQVETVAAAVQVETVAVAIEERTAGEATLKKSDGDTTLLKDDISCVEVKQREEPTDCQERSADQVEKSAAILDPQNFSDIHSHCFSKSQFEPKREQTPRDTKSESTSEKSHVGSAGTGFSSPVASESAVLELEQESHTEKSSNKPSSCVLPAEDVPIHQKGESKVTTDCQSRGSRFQKLKPKPNLMQASRTSKSEPKRPEEKGSTPDPKFHLNEPHDASKPPMDLGAEERSVRKEKTACVPQVDSDATSVQGTSENQNFPEAQFAESSCKNMVTTATESQAGSIVHVAPVQEESGALVTPVELPLSQEEGKGASTSQVRRGQSQKVKPKPNLQQTSRTVRSKPQTQNLTPSPQNLQEIQAEEEMSMNEEKRTHVDQAASDHSANENLKNPESTPQRVKGKEELSTQQCSPQSCGSMSRPESTNKSAKVEEDKKQPPPENSSQIQRTSPVPVSVPSPLHTTALSSTKEEKSDVECGVVSSSEGSSPSVPQRRRRLPKVKPNIRSSTRTTLIETHDIRTASILTSEQQPEDGVKLTGNAELTSHHPTPVEASLAQPDNRESTNSNPNPDLSEASDVLTVQSCDDAHSEVTDSPKTSKKTCRGRFVKPKPNLGSSSRPLQPKQSTTHAVSDSGSCSLHMDAPVVGGPVPGLKRDIQGPAAEATNQALNVAGSCLVEEIKPQSQYNCPSTDPQPSVGSASSLQNVTSIAESVLNFPGVFTDMLPEQVPSDPDEPFFILSLTEIPVSSSGEVMNSTAEHPSYPPVTDTSVNPQSSVSGAAGDTSLSCVPEPTHKVMNDVTGPDPAVCLGSFTEGTVDPCWVAKAEPPKSPETEGKNKSENPSTKQRMTATGKQAKQQAKTRTAWMKQNRETLAAEEADSTQSDSTQDSEHSADPPHQDQETVEGGKVSDSSTREQSIETSGQKRKPKDFPSIDSEMNKTAPSRSPSLAKAAPKGSRVKTKQSQQQTPSVSHTVTPTQPPKEASSVLTTLQRDVDLSCLDPTPSTSQTSVSDCVEHSTVNEEEEPTNVSQYFLSDIFTDVEEG